MDTYKLFCNDTDINMVLDTINEMYSKAQPNMMTACHGRYHTMFVVDMTEHILTTLEYDPRTIELGKIAALLHDIGSVAGRWNHAQKSAALARVYFDGCDNLNSDEKDIVVQAIADHSNGNNISSAVGAALIIADKADISKRRILPIDTIDAWHKNLLEIENVDVRISDKIITIDHIVIDAFCKELHKSEYTKGFIMLVKAAKYLGCECRFYINGKTEGVWICS